MIRIVFIFIYLFFIVFFLRPWKSLFFINLTLIGTLTLAETLHPKVGDMSAVPSLNTEDCPFLPTSLQ